MVFSTFYKAFNYETNLYSRKILKDFEYTKDKNDTSIDIFTAYKRYIASKPWVAANYLRDPSRKPNWIA